MGATPGQTPVRDQLSINPEESLVDEFDGSQMSDVRTQLRMGLKGLPAPKNDFEIVVPEDEATQDDAAEGEGVIETDASEEDERRARLKKEEGACGVTRGGQGRGVTMVMCRVRLLMTLLYLQRRGSGSGSPKQCSAIFPVQLRSMPPS